MGDVIERRWRNHFFRPLLDSDTADLELVRGWVEEHLEPYLSGMFEQLLDGARFRVGDMGSERGQIGALRNFMNLRGFEVSGGPWPHANHQMRFLGRVSEGAPIAACILGPWDDEYRLPAASLFLEALPLDITVEHVRVALEVLPEIPATLRRSPLPQHDKPLTGRYAEWARNAQALFETIELVRSQPNV